MIDELKTDYKDDVLATSQQGKRTFNIVGKNGEILFEDVHIEDTSKYTQVGDEYGQEIINEQNSAINQLSKGTGYVFDTYAEYLEAYQGGEIPNGAIVYIKEGSVDGTITALQVKYNDSNVKLALDSLSSNLGSKSSASSVTGNDAFSKIATLKNSLSNIKFLASANTPTSENGTVTITLSEAYTNYTFLAIRYGFGWGWSAWTIVPTTDIGIINVVGAYDSIVRHGRIDILSATSIKVTAISLLGTTASPNPVDKVEVYGVIKR